jgi:hypothetical protein
VIFYFEDVLKFKPLPQNNGVFAVFEKKILCKAHDKYQSNYHLKSGKAMAEN